MSFHRTKEDRQSQNEDVYHQNLSKVQQSLTLHRTKEENLTRQEYYETMEENFPKILVALSLSDDELREKLDEQSPSVEFAKKTFGKREPETKEERLAIYITAVQHESILYFKRNTK